MEKYVDELARGIEKLLNNTESSVELASAYSEIEEVVERILSDDGWEEGIRYLLTCWRYGVVPASGDLLKTVLKYITIPVLSIITYTALTVNHIITTTLTTVLSCTVLCLVTALAVCKLTEEIFNTGVTVGFLLSIFVKKMTEKARR
ncbi:MAG: hypothetical protein DRJ40_11770 [Thermoprotei archaeon]|nr:MAG: hypothetical protein DRJ40_11770 [Thermoprotei archaeon]